MNETDYINSVVGLPYEEGANGDGSFDCWGLIPHSFKHIENIEIPKATDRINCNLHESAKTDLKNWIECGERESQVFFCYKNGIMVHCGRVLLLNKALHAAGNITNGQVMVWSIRKLKLFYKEVRFFKYANN